VLEGQNRGAVIRLLPATVARLGRDGAAEIVLPDEGVSRFHAEVRPGGAGGPGFEVRDLESKNGTRLNGVRIDAAHPLAHGDEIRVGDTLLLFVEEDEEGDRAAPLAGDTATALAPAPAGAAPAPAAPRPAAAAAREPARSLVGESAAMRRVGALVERLAPVDSTVLIVGESGTGKELVAEALHRLGPRRRGPFLAVNCASLEPALLESDLFGHERGAFTGAVARRLGKLELARGGTLFLDEVGELPPEAQAKLLRAIERLEFQRVGGHEVLRTDARLVAATNRDLVALVREGRFREDLLFRLRVVEVEIPPLRERPGDVAALVDHFQGELSARIPTRARRGFAPAAVERLLAYRFPGNVRELRNIVERCLILAEGERIEVADLPVEVRAGAPPAASAGAGPEPVTLDDVERRHIERTLASTGGNKTRAASLLGIDRATLYAKIKRYGLER